MARRVDQRGVAKLGGAAGAKRVRGAIRPAPADADDIAALKHERDGLAEQLAGALARIAELERRQAELADRIVWAIDTLQSLTDETE